MKLRPPNPNRATRPPRERRSPAPVRFVGRARLSETASNPPASDFPPSPPSDGGEGRGEEGRYVLEFPSPRSSPHSFLMGRGSSHRTVLRSGTAEGGGLEAHSQIGNQKSKIGIGQSLLPPSQSYTATCASAAAFLSFRPTDPLERSAFALPDVDAAGMQMPTVPQLQIQNSLDAQTSANRNAGFWNSRRHPNQNQAHPPASENVCNRTNNPSRSACAVRNPTWRTGV